jgi:hypothetical protein
MVCSTGRRLNWSAANRYLENTSIMSHEELSEKIRETFNDVAREGGAIRLVGRTEGTVLAIPVSIHGIAGGGTYVSANSPAQSNPFVPNRFEQIARIGFVHNARVVDPNGDVVRNVPTSLVGFRCRFDVWSLPRGDVYRVEVAPDQTFGPVKQISQIHAGTHVHAVQHFDVVLEGSAQKDFMISVQKVDEATARRDRNEDAPKLWEATYPVVV